MGEWGGVELPDATDEAWEPARTSCGGRRPDGACELKLDARDAAESESEVAGEDGAGLPRSTDSNSEPARGRRWRLGGVAVEERVEDAREVVLEPRGPRPRVRDRAGRAGVAVAGAGAEEREGGRVADGAGLPRGRGGRAGADEVELDDAVRVIGMSDSVMVLRLGGSLGGVIVPPAPPPGPGTACNAATAVLPLRVLPLSPPSIPPDLGATVHSPSPSPLASSPCRATGQSPIIPSPSCFATVPAMLNLVSSGAAVELALPDL